jgi:glutamate-1-semialdehyde 2,1-aminomutase
VFFTGKPVRNYQDAKTANTKRYARYFREMLDRGIFLAPSQFEAAFVSAAHSEADIARAVEAARQCLLLVANAT